MTDIFQEVDEDLRREQINRLWKKYGPQTIAAFVVLLVVAVGIVAYKEWRQSQARVSSEKFQSVIHSGENVKPDDPAVRIAALDKIDAGLTPGYKLLANFERAGALAESGQADAAAKVLDAIAASGSTDEAVRDLAQVKSAMLQADNLTLNDMRARVGNWPCPRAPSGSWPANSSAMPPSMLAISRPRAIPFRPFSPTLRRRPTSKSGRRSC